MFPPLLKHLQISTLFLQISISEFSEPLDVSVLAQNQYLGGLETLILHEDRPPSLNGDDWSQTDFREQFAALVNAPGFERLEDLRLDMPQLNDACCEALVKSTMLKRLRRLWLAGKGITDVGAATLATSQEIRSLEELRLGGDGLTEQGYETLRAAGVQVLRPDDGRRR
jgi:hypothetical protein